MGKHLKAFYYFLMLSGIVQLVSLILWFKQINNLPILHFYTPLGFIWLTLFYQRILKGIINKTILWGILIMFILYSVLNTIFIQPINTYNSYSLTVESILIIIYSLSTFTFMLNSISKDTKVGGLQSLNWINSGLFIYYTSSLLIFYFGSSLAVDSAPLIAQYAWAIHGFFSIIMYSFFTVGIWKRHS